MRRYRYPLSAFTLVELLVVIAIIALLAALAIPAIGGAIKRSNAAKCMANLKQIGVAYRNLATENENMMTLAWDSNGSSWCQNILVYIFPNNWKKDMSLMKCPTDNRPPRSDLYRSYGMNTLLVRNNSSGQPPRFSAIPEQSKTFLIMDVADDVVADPRYAAQSPTNRHGTNCNVLFVDGHVETLTAATIKNAISTLTSDTERTTNAYRWK